MDLNRNKSPLCNIRKNSGIAQVINRCYLIVWAECTINDKRTFEASDRTLNNIRNNDSLICWIPVFVSGDFRRMFPVMPKGSRASLKSSMLWRHVEILKLKINMRACLYGDITSNQFVEILLTLGKGRFPTGSESFIDPSLICILVPSTLKLIAEVYPNTNDHYQNGKWLLEILALKK